VLVELLALIFTPELRGQWESYPRELTKCRRCRKAKCCGKEYQSTAWSKGNRIRAVRRQEMRKPLSRLFNNEFGGRGWDCERGGLFLGMQKGELSGRGRGRHTCGSERWQPLSQLRCIVTVHSTSLASELSPRIAGGRRCSGSFASCRFLFLCAPFLTRHSSTCLEILFTRVFWWKNPTTR
jgi:hypothetical protein